MRFDRLLATFSAWLMAAIFAAGAWAAPGPAWMPNFPMRMGAAGVMGMWMPLPGATEYKVQRQVGGGTWEEIYKGPMNNFQDPAAPQDKDVAYRVVAVVGGADTDPSPVVTLAGLKPVEPPRDVRHRLDPANRAVGLGWGRAEGASFYNVYRAEKAGDAGALLGSVQDLKYTDAAVEEGKTYWYRLSSVSTAGQESPRGEAVEVAVKFPKVVVAKKFEFNPILMKLVRVSRGEDFAEFKNPSDILLLGDQLYVACEDGIQVLDADGVYVSRLPLFQEKVAKGEWKRPFLLAASPAGNILAGALGENVIREVTPDGASLVREIRLPDLPGHPNPAQALVMDVGPDGTRWIVDSTYSTLQAVPAAAGDSPSNDAIRRYGFPRATKEKYDPAKHGDIFVGAGRVRFSKERGKLLIVEATAGKLSAVDPATGKKEFSVLGIGGGFHEVSLLGDFVPYDAQSVLIADPLTGEIKQIKVTAADDPANGDYLASFVDDPERKQPKLQAMMSNVNRLQYDPARRRLYALSVQGQEVAIYDLP